ncbi:MAG: glycerate kinase [Pseudomonadota bacterium]|nr:glycerate kinase [Pseudomonadota bacterium]
MLRSAFDQAVEVAQATCLIPHLTDLPPIAGKTVFLVVGKAASQHAQVAQQCLGDIEGLCILPRGHEVNTSLQVIEASHPVPDGGSLRAAEDALTLARSLGPNDRMICLISGGGSALMSAPLPTMDPELKMRTHRALLASGATISELNTVRKQLSLVKGGRLVEACRGTILNFLVSDVPGDRVEFIASGPTVPAYTNQADAIAVLTRHKIDVLDELTPWLSDQNNATPHPESLCFERVSTQIVAAPSQSLRAAREFLESEGVECWVLGDSIEGDSETVARVMAETALWQRRHRTLAKPLCLLSGGETTVKVTGSGVGGPNAHFALALLDALDGARGISAIACDTDGVDGAAEIAGAVIDDQTLARMRDANLDHCDALRCQDAHTFFQTLGQSVISGPTGTNVNDFRAILIEP